MKLDKNNVKKFKELDFMPVKTLTKTIQVKYLFKQYSVIVSLCSTLYFYDIIAECSSTRALKYIKKKLGVDSSIIISGVFGSPLLVVNTFSDLSSAKEFFYQFEDILVGGMI